MHIIEIQKFCSELLSRVTYPRVGTIIGLQEEVGKVAKIVMDIEIYGRPFEKKLFEKKCSELFFSFIDLCNSYDINIENVSRIRIKEIQKKIEGWEKEHSSALKNKRKKFD
ncbi:MAG: hypothetical protein PHY40_04395 [Patescibacteria group bacterium]|jgi:hypothetical protein|nr:hypothetical protein [Patescibacteria group bacterium]